MNREAFGRSLGVVVYHCDLFCIRKPEAQAVIDSSLFARDDTEMMQAAIYSAGTGVKMLLALRVCSITRPLRILRAIRIGSSGGGAVRSTGPGAVEINGARRGVDGISFAMNVPQRAY